MPLHLLPLTSPLEFPSLTKCEIASYAQDNTSFFKLFHPDPSPSGFASLVERQVRDFETDNTVRWVMVVDDDVGDGNAEDGKGDGGEEDGDGKGEKKGKGKVIAGAKWNIYEENPYGTGPWGYPVAEADWWAEGEPRDFANRLYDALLRPRREKMARPHILLAMLFTHPSHRRRGAASLLLNWGMREADRLGLEIFLEATDDGKPCYEAHGFLYMGTNYWEAAKRNPSKEWAALERYLQTPIHTYLMWRPVLGRLEGEEVRKREVEIGYKVEVWRR